MRQLLEAVRNETSLLEPALAVDTGSDVRLEGGNAKTLLVIEEEVDLGREKVPVIHSDFYEKVDEVVSVKARGGSRGWGLGLVDLR